MNPDQMYEDAMAMASRGDIPACIRGLQDVLIASPNHASAWNNRASMLLKLGHPFDAVMNYDYALQAKPETPEFHNNRGAAYIDLGMFDHAMRDFEKAVEIKPKFEHALMNMGNVCIKQRKTAEAKEFYRQSIAVNENYVDAHLGLAFSLLELGEYEEGWKEFEWRWKSEQCPGRGLALPEWKGTKCHSPSDGLLLYAEQGHGDALQFMRYAQSVRDKWCGKVYIEVRQPLARLAKSLKGPDGIVVFGEKLPLNIVCCLPMMSAPRVMGTTLNSIPMQWPYLHADPYRTAMWKKALTALPPGMKVGICWAGGARPLQPVANAIDKRRSATLQEFGRLAMPGVSWVSLQVGPQAEQVKTPPVGMTIGDWSDEIHDYYDTAALIECLDLVISVDTSVVHLAAAMGKPVWLLSRYDNCWRWLHDRKDSPWYPTVTQFRQPSSGDWAGVMDEVRGELKSLLSRRMAA